MTLFDLLATAAIVLSLLAGVSNGAVRELVGLFAFGLAVGGAVLLLPVSRPLARATVHPSWASGAVAIVVAFLVIYIGLQVAGRFLTARLRRSGGLGALDRVGGGAIGLVRAVVLLGGLYLLYNALVPLGARPPWVERAALLPLARTAGQGVQAMTPKGAAAAGALGPALRNAMSNPDPGAGVEFGHSADKNGVEETPPAPPPLRRRTGKQGSTAKQEASHKGVDVVVDRSR